MDGGSAVVQPPRDLRLTDSVAEQFADIRGFDCRCDGSAETHALCVRGPVQHDTFAEYVVLELDKACRPCSASGCGQIKCFSEGNKANLRSVSSCCPVFMVNLPRQDGGSSWALNGLAEACYVTVYDHKSYSEGT